MKRIGILSDTHSSLHKGILSFFADCDEIWHAGDIGKQEVIDQLETICPVKAVYGNIDDSNFKLCYKEIEEFSCENIRVSMIHIGGYPKNYRPKARKSIHNFHPKLFISGHSHILKVIYDKEAQCLHINPGAAGNSGYHHKVTAIRLIIDKDDIKDLEIFEADRKSSKFISYKM